jgi:C_GCAxxG_C_C family probable redox protein
MSRAQEAVNGFKNGFSCPQSILCTYCDDYDLDMAMALKLAAGFGGGIGGMGKMCGCVTGAIMILGLRYGAAKVKDPEAKKRTNAAVQEFIKKFEACRGSIVCRDLLGCDIGTDDGFKRAQDEKLFSTICPKIVESAATILEELVDPDQAARG